MHLLLDKIIITKTYLYNIDPLKPHFYIIKLGFTGVCIILAYFSAKKIIYCRYSLETPRNRLMPMFQFNTIAFPVSAVLSQAYLFHYLRYIVLINHNYSLFIDGFHYTTSNV